MSLEVHLTARMLKALPEYSRTLPTATTPGKIWRSRSPDGWSLGMYGEPEGDVVPIYWFDVVLVEGPEPAGVLERWESTDWSNYGRWSKDRANGIHH